jgi:uncharacterized Zn finger protein (UPF0148 family)
MPMPSNPPNVIPSQTRGIGLLIKYTVDGNVICPCCGFKCYYHGQSIKKCKHLAEAHYDKFKFKHKWVFDKAGRGFKPTFTIKQITPEENKNVKSKSQMAKMVR